MPRKDVTATDCSRITTQPGAALFAERLRAAAAEVNRTLVAELARCAGAPAPLLESMQYSLDAGGKRLRPILTLWWSDLLGGRRSHAMPAAVAIELVHTFSLIHDDLPALDNDDLRRGRPTNHKVFGEATAILAGDALLTLAFEVLAHGPAPAATTVTMIAELAEATGCRGMIGGESADLDGENAPPDRKRVETIHAAKTARLIEASCRLGALAAETKADPLAAAQGYGRSLGLAFQAADDLLDVTGSTAHIGKVAGKDAAAGKQTYPRAVGVEETRRIMRAKSTDAVNTLAAFGPEADDLRALARYVIERDR